MSKQTEALKLALEALKTERWPVNPHLTMVKTDAAITAIREALAEQPAHESAYQRGYMDGIAKGLRMEQPAQQQCMEHGECFGGECIYPATQPAQHQEPEPDRVKFERHWRKTRGDKKANRELPRHPLQPQTYIQDSANRHWVTWQAAVRSVAPPASKPWVGLTELEALGAYEAEQQGRWGDHVRGLLAVEAKLREKNT